MVLIGTAIGHLWDMTSTSDPQSVQHMVSRLTTSLISCEVIGTIYKTRSATNENLSRAKTRRPDVAQPASTLEAGAQQFHPRDPTDGGNPESKTAEAGVPYEKEIDARGTQ